MNKREWKYLRKQYIKRKKYGGYGWKLFTIDHFEPVDWTEPIGGYLQNFGLLIPKGAFIPHVHKKHYRSLSDIRFNTNFDII